MKQVCLMCERTSDDGNLYCQEPHCPAEMSPTILDSGEWCGDIEVVRQIAILRSAVLYEAVHQKRKVFLKVAHPGQEHKERLKREAEILSSLQRKRRHQRTLPSLLPPYPGTTIAHDAYGKIMLGGHLLYFYLFEPFEGETLRDVLAKNPQLWINHVGWIAIDLAATVNFLHMQGLLLLGLGPDSLLVRFDDDTGAPRLLLFDLGIASSPADLSGNWYPGFVPPAYTAPELIGGSPYGGSVDYRSDVHGVGLVLYEMLVGQPVYPYKLASEAEVYLRVVQDHRTPMNRVEDVQRVAEIATTASNHDPALRQKDASELAKQLEALFGPVPPEKRRSAISLNALVFAVAVLLVVAFLLGLALSMSGAAG